MIGFKTTSVNVSDIQNEANAYVLDSITKNIMGSTLTVTAKTDESSKQTDSQKTSVTGKTDGKSNSDTASLVLFFIMLISLIMFSVIQLPNKIRSISFYLSFLFFCIILLVDHKNHKVILWLSIVLYAIGLIVNVKKWKIGDNILIGGGFSRSILPYPKPGSYVPASPSTSPSPSPSTSHNVIKHTYGKSRQAQNRQMLKNKEKQKQSDSSATHPSVYHLKNKNGNIHVIHPNKKQTQMTPAMRTPIPKPIKGSNSMEA